MTDEDPGRKHTPQSNIKVDLTVIIMKLSDRNLQGPYFSSRKVIPKVLEVLPQVVGIPPII